jgi:hyperosmotically inducible protein
MCATVPTARPLVAYCLIEFRHSPVGPAASFWFVDRKPESSSRLFYLPLGVNMNTFSKTLSAAFLAITLVSVVGCATTSQQEGTGQYIDDTVITAKVKAAIFDDSLTKASEINVETYKGVVQLSGFVSSQAAANRAVDLARGVNGVKSVKNDMRLK